ncbi:MAG: sigma factor-like helix-turn-helix DNA-binding protein [Actinomycetota bacterium]
MREVWDGPGGWPIELTELDREHRIDFVRLAYMIVGDRFAAEELVEEAMAACAPNWSRCAHPRFYLVTLVVGRCLAWLRTDPTPDAGVAAVQGEGAGDDAMWQALGELDGKRRVALVLRFHEQLSDAHIAAVLGCSAATVDTLIPGSAGRNATVHGADGETFERIFAAEMRAMLQRRAADVGASKAPGLLAFERPNGLEPGAGDGLFGPGIS